MWKGNGWLQSDAESVYGTDLSAGCCYNPAIWILLNSILDAGYDHSFALRLRKCWYCFDGGALTVYVAYLNAAVGHVALLVNTVCRHDMLC